MITECQGFQSNSVPLPRRKACDPAHRTRMKVRTGWSS